MKPITRRYMEATDMLGLASTAFTDMATLFIREFDVKDTSPEKISALFKQELRNAQEDIATVLEKHIPDHLMAKALEFYESETAREIKTKQDLVKPELDVVFQELGEDISQQLVGIFGLVDDDDDEDEDEDSEDET